MNDPLLIIPTHMRNRNEYEVTAKAVASAYSTTGINPLVIDDASPYSAGVDELDLGGFRVLRQRKNSGFSATVNIGLKMAKDEYSDAVLINADIEFHDDTWLKWMQDSKGDVVGARLLYPNGLIQHAGIYFSVIMRCYDHIYRFAPGDLPAACEERVCPVTGALQYIRAEVLNKVGLYDEDFKMGYEDVDYCLRVFQAGYKCVYQPKATAIHQESMFRGKATGMLKKWQQESWGILQKKHDGLDISNWVPMMLGGR